MESILSELPLALFTTLASIGAGSFIALTIHAYCSNPDAESALAVDKKSIISLCFVLIGFIAAFFHLCNPLHAVGVLSGIGTSPLSNEIVAGSVFTVVAIIYVILGCMGKLSGSGRKIFLVVLTLLAIIFAIFMGTAYMINTIPSWNTVASPIQMVGCALAGGSILGTLVLFAAHQTDAASKSSCKTALIVLGLAGLAVAIIGLVMMAVQTNGLVNATTAGADLVSAALPFLILAIVLLAAGAVGTAVLVNGKTQMSLAVLFCVFVTCGVLCGRFAFYAMQISVAL